MSGYFESPVKNYLEILEKYQDYYNIYSTPNFIERRFHKIKVKINNILLEYTKKTCSIDSLISKLKKNHSYSFVNEWYKSHDLYILDQINEIAKKKDISQSQIEFTLHYIKENLNYDSVRPLYRCDNNRFFSLFDVLYTLTIKSSSSDSSEKNLEIFFEYLSTYIYDDKYLESYGKYPDCKELEDIYPKMKHIRKRARKTIDTDTLSLISSYNIPLFSYEIINNKYCPKEIFQDLIEDNILRKVIVKSKYCPPSVLLDLIEKYNNEIETMEELAANCYLTDSVYDKLAYLNNKMINNILCRNFFVPDSIKIKVFNNTFTADKLKEIGFVSLYDNNYSADLIRLVLETGHFVGSYKFDPGNIEIYHSDLKYHPTILLNHLIDFYFFKNLFSENNTNLPINTNSDVEVVNRLMRYNSYKDEIKWYKIVKKILKGYPDYSANIVWAGGYRSEYREIGGFNTCSGYRESINLILFNKNRVIDDITVRGKPLPKEISRYSKFPSNFSHNVDEEHVKIRIKEAIVKDKEKNIFEDVEPINHNSEYSDIYKEKKLNFLFQGIRYNIPINRISCKKIGNKIDIIVSKFYFNNLKKN